MFYSFIWNDKPDKIRRSLAINKFENGGIGMISIELFNQSLKLTWIRKLMTSNSSWKNLLLKKYQILMDIFNFGNDYTKRILTIVKNTFWRDILQRLNDFTTKFIVKSC